MAEVGLVRFARLVFEVSQAVLPAHRTKFSKYVFTQPQLLAVLCLMPFIEDSVEPGSVAHIDGWLGYLPLEGKGCRHEITYLKGNSKTALGLMPRVHLAVARLKRWLMGTHQAGVSLEHLDAYLDGSLSVSNAANRVAGASCSVACSNRRHRRAGSIQILGQMHC